MPSNRSGNSSRAKCAPSFAIPKAGVAALPNASAEHRRALQRASRAPRSTSGKALLRERGEHLERGFCHVLAHGGLRRATLRDCEKQTMRQLAGALSHSQSLLLRHLVGIGTLKQARAAARTAPLRIVTRFGA